MKNREEKAKEKIEFLVKVTDGVMWWIGSIPSLIAHSLIFLSAFLLPIFGMVDFDKMLLVLTTVLSLEAIYLAIFIQMSVNRSQEHIEDLKDDVNEIQEDIEDIQEDIEEISEDIDDIQEDIEDIAEDEDDEDHNERAKNVMLKSNVSSNKNDIKAMREVIANLQKRLEDLKIEDEKANRLPEK
jgi:peptidoglycan hydrolase CwlO-like protein